MKTFDMLKQSFNIEKKSLKWAVIEETVNGVTAYKAGIMLSKSKLFIDICQRRFYTEVHLPELSRRVFPAKRILKSEKIVFQALEDSSKSVSMPKNFIQDIYSVCWYDKQLEKQILL